MEGGEPEIRKAVDKAYNRLQDLKSKLSESEKERAIAEGILDENGNIPYPDFFPASGMTAPANVTPPSSSQSYPCWGWTPETAAKWKELKDRHIEDSVMNLIRGFQVIPHDSARAIAEAFFTTGIVGIGITAVKTAYKVAKALIQGAAAITEELGEYSIFEGIMAVGTSVIALAAELVVSAILIPIFVLMEKPAAIVMVILNNTSEDMTLDDYAVTHGKINCIFKATAKEEHPRAVPVIPKIEPPLIYPKTKKPVKGSGVVYAGFLGASKREMALIGTQGALKFQNAETFPSGVSIGWEIPLSIGKNRLWVSVNFKRSVEDVSEKVNDDGKQSDSSTNGKGGKVFGNMNSGSGSHGYMIAFIDM